MIIRPETPADGAAVHAVVAAAFGQPAEAVLVDRLRAAGLTVVSLVAEEGGTVVGHILFSPVSIEQAPRVRRAAGLAPLSVAPARQRDGIGTALGRAGVAACAAAGIDALVGLGPPAYSPRFGFAPAAPSGLHSVYGGADDGAFMAMELTPGALDGARGLVRYAAEFDAV